MLIYIAGFISRTITHTCVVNGKRTAGLVDVLNKANSSHVFIAAKQYQDLTTGGLVVSSSDVLHVYQVRCRLVTRMLT